MKIAVGNLSLLQLSKTDADASSTDTDVTDSHLEAGEIRELLMTILFVLRHCDASVISSYLASSATSFFKLLDLCVRVFQYRGADALPAERSVQTQVMKKCVEFFYFSSAALNPVFGSSLPFWHVEPTLCSFTIKNNRGLLSDRQGARVTSRRQELAGQAGAGCIYRGVADISTVECRVLSHPPAHLVVRVRHVVSCLVSSLCILSLIIIVLNS